MCMLKADSEILLSPKYNTADIKNNENGKADLLS